jgi:hypothetical protein
VAFSPKYDIPDNPNPNILVLVESRKNIEEVNEFFINPVTLPDDKEQSSGMTLR